MSKHPYEMMFWLATANNGRALISPLDVRMAMERDRKPYVFAVFEDQMWIRDNSTLLVVPYKYGNPINPANWVPRTDAWFDVFDLDSILLWSLERETLADALEREVIRTAPRSAKVQMNNWGTNLLITPVAPDKLVARLIATPDEDE